jgi:hypothetical protein
LPVGCLRLPPFPSSSGSYLANWVNKTDQMLQNVSSTMSNVYVNLISTLDLSNIARIQRSNLKCTVEHK